MGIIDCSSNYEIDLNKLEDFLWGGGVIWLVNAQREGTGHFGQQPGNKLDTQRVTELTTFSFNSHLQLLPCPIAC